MKTTIKELVKQMKGHSDTTKEKMVREFCLQVVDEIDMCPNTYMRAVDGSNVYVDRKEMDKLKEQL